MHESHCVRFDGDELVVFEETDLARKIDARMTPGKTLKTLRDVMNITQAKLGEVFRTSPAVFI